MTCTCRLQDLLTLLDTKAATTATIAADYRRVDRGLLSVGLKIHCLDEGRQFARLIEGLGGAACGPGDEPLQRRACIAVPCAAAGGKRHFRHYASSNASRNSSARQFLAIGKSNCSYARLGGSMRGHPLCLRIGFYLGSDTLRRYTQADLRTTFASHFTHPRGIRLVLYDADGDFDRDFAWWNRWGSCEPRASVQKWTNRSSDRFWKQVGHSKHQSVGNVARSLRI